MCPNFRHNYIICNYYRLKYDRTTNQYSRTSDLITVEAPEIGKTYAVENLGGDMITSRFLDHFKEFVDYFVERGYERGKSIRAAPYDWRVGPGMTQCTYAHD